VTANLLVLIGRAATDGELRFHHHGDSVCTFKPGTKRNRRSGDEVTEWHSVVVEGGQALRHADSARRASEIVRKGAQIYVEGRLAYRKGRENDFNVAIVLAHRVEVLTPAPNRSPTPVPATEPDNPSRDGQVLTGDLGSDVPF
jgi:single-stranded DNA-binding protein